VGEASSPVTCVLYCGHGYCTFPDWPRSASTPEDPRCSNVIHLFLENKMKNNERRPGMDFRQFGWGHHIIWLQQELKPSCVVQRFDLHKSICTFICPSSSESQLDQTSCPPQFQDITSDLLIYYLQYLPAHLPPTYLPNLT
jgi:hypothetical protein